jgi:hypothetical protein
MVFTRRGSLPVLATLGFASWLWLVPTSAASGQEQKGPEAAESQPSVWMRKKLDYSRNILAGLASEDFDKVVTNAQAMQGMSRFEGFLRGKMPGYRTQLEVFQDANEQIIKQAQKDNVEGAALAFTQLTISCVNCHKQLRESK